MSKRTNTEVINSRTVFEETVDTIAQLQLDLARMKVERDEAKEALIAQHNTRIKSMETEIKTLQTAAQGYAQIHWTELAPSEKARSANTPFATYGFRTGQPMPVPIGKKKEADIAQELHEAGHIDLVDIKLSLNKKAILRAIRDGVVAICALFRIRQTERFYVEAKAQQD